MPKPKHIILFLIDGLRPDGLQQAATPHVDRLVADGAATWRAQSVTPSVTLPCHVSLFCAVPPARHGVVTNVWVPPQSPLPGLIDVVHGAGAGTAAFYNWEQLRDLSSPGALDFAYYHRLGEPPVDRDLEIGAVAAAYVAEHRPAFAFVYLGATDAVGHRYGWMSESYLEAIHQADRAIGLVLGALREAGCLADTTCLVLADHGGHDFDHGAGLAEDLTVPWIISGPGVRRGHSVTAPVGITDTAPTIAHLLGLPMPPEWTGRVVTEALA
ncbi:MAG TPA: alkaline phosphatase family protein [Anaerolineae bacterium]|nr:alkaline phosphatase family protein [Anaerolineae bacterium]